MKDIVIGIDTSAYTTSLCATNIDTYAIEFERRKILDVPLGERGLRQNTAVFQHLKNLPFFVEELFSEIDANRIACIAVSDKPRPIIDSYMPVFFAGNTYARVMSASLSIPLYTFSHQEGHIAVGIGTLPTKINSTRFLAIHISGGTSEVCLVKESEDKQYEIDLIGSSLDLHAGQFVDRVGVKMGLSFPAGKELELLGQQCTTKLAIPSSVRGLNFSFSGPATNAERLLDEGFNHADVSRAVENCIAKTLEKIIIIAKKEYNIADVLIVGGVAANSTIREYLTSRLAHRTVDIKTHYAKKEYSSDNSYGTSLLGIYKHISCNYGN